MAHYAHYGALRALYAARFFPVVGGRSGMEIGLVWYALAVYLATQSPPGATSGLKAVSGEHVLAKNLHPADDLMEGRHVRLVLFRWRSASVLSEVGVPGM